MRGLALASLGLIAVLFALLAYVPARSTETLLTPGEPAVSWAAESEAAAIDREIPRVVERSATSRVELRSNDPVEGLLLEIVDEATGAPVEGASVHVWVGDRDPRLPPDSTAAPSDALGRARLPTPTSTMFVRASTETLFGDAYVEVGARALRVELSPSGAIDVHVKDENGLGAEGVLLEAQRGAPGDASTVADAITDAEGHARIHVRRSDLLDDVLELLLTAPLQSATPELVLLNFDALPQVPIELTVGPSGSLEISLVDSNGDLVDSDEDVIVSADTNRDGSALSASAANASTIWRLDGGRAVVEQLALGRHWEIFLWPERYPAAWISVAGPTRRGERVHAKFVVAEELPILRGRAIGPNGAPLAQRSLSLRPANDPPGTGSAHEVRTGDDGRFETHTGRMLPFTLGETAEVFPTHEPELFARTRWPEPIVRNAAVRQTVFDFGDLRLEKRELPKLCEGIVVDADGAPVQSARVQLRARPADTFGGAELAVWSDANGRFEIRGEPRVNEFWLSASHRSAESAEPQLVKRGDGNVRLVMTPLAQLRGELLLPARARANEIELRVQRWSEDGQLIGWRGTQLRLGSVSYLESVKAPCFCVVQLLFESHVICESPRIALEPGVVRDAPLLDARESLHVVDLMLVDADGRPLTDGGLEWTDGYGCEHVTAVFVDGLARLHSRAPLVDVIARVPGYRSEWIRSVADGSTLTLERAAAVAIQGPALGAHAQRFEIRLELRRTSDVSVDSTWLDPVTVTLDRDGCGAVALGQVGKYRVEEASLLERATVAKTWIEVPESLELSIDGSGAPLNIAISDGALTEALARLR